MASHNQPKNTQYLDPEVVAALSSLDLRARMVVEGVMTGLHQSPYHGFSVEFSQHRQYAAGDDIRHLDWKVYGKTERLYLKQYHQETNLDLIVMLDSSESMSYAGHGHKIYNEHQTVTNGIKQSNWGKYDYAATLSAAISYIALNHQDRVAMGFVSDGHDKQMMRLSNKQGQWKSIVNHLEKQRLEVCKYADEKSRISMNHKQSDVASSQKSKQKHGIFEHTISNLTKRSLIVLISDLYFDVPVLKDAMALLSHNGHDFLILQVVHREEEELSLNDYVQFIGLEAEGYQFLDPRALKKAYQQEIQQHTKEIENAARSFGFDLLKICTDDSFSGPLQQFITKRNASINKGGRS